MIEIRKKRPVATIKGVFVNSHIQALRRKKGDKAVRELERRYGAALYFGAFDNVPVRDEVRIIELVLDLLHEHGLVGGERAFAAGALHFENFSQTTLGSTLMHSLPHGRENFFTLLHNAGSIARVVFAHTNFRARAVSKGMVVTIENCDYPIEHFQGFFTEWMRFWGLDNPKVGAREIEQGVFEYRLEVA